MLQFLVLFVLWRNDSIVLPKKGWIVLSLCHEINELLIDIEWNKTRDFGCLVYFFIQLLHCQYIIKLNLNYTALQRRGCYEENQKSQWTSMSHVNIGKLIAAFQAAFESTVVFSRKSYSTTRPKLSTNLWCWRHPAHWWEELPVGDGRPKISKIIKIKNHKPPCSTEAKFECALQMSTMWKQYLIKQIALI